MATCKERLAGVKVSCIVLLVAAILWHCVRSEFEAKCNVQTCVVDVRIQDQACSVVFGKVRHLSVLLVRLAGLILLRTLESKFGFVVWQNGEKGRREWYRTNMSRAVHTI